MNISPMHRHLEAWMGGGSLLPYGRRLAVRQAFKLSSNLMFANGIGPELGRWSHVFNRYAYDCKIYVKDQAAGERVMVKQTPDSVGIGIT
ncbi:MAG: hypothetical protein ABIR84_00895 [Candidatus Nitrotoga sp.]